MGVAEGLLKRYSRVAAKPIVLALLFYITVIWLCFFFWFTPRYDPRSMFVDPRMPPEIKAQELERLENFGSFLNSILQWNFGRSFSLIFAPVIHELSWRIKNTLILIGFSSAGSILAGAIIALIAFIRKPNKQRPLTFAHSLKCFLFGLTPFIALTLIDIFCLHLGLAPKAGLFSLPPPSPGSANWYMDILAHLFMPVLTLTLINAIRSAVIIWSGSFSLDSKSPWKIFLLSITTIDFTFMVSATVFAEVMFSIPGVGPYLISSLYNKNHNATIGSFIALLAIAVGLGVVSAFLDLLQVSTGIREDLEKPSSQRSEIEKQPHKRPQTKNKLTNYLKRKSLIVGLIIVSFFTVSGIAAPLLTPYLSESQFYRAPKVACSFAMPQWMTIFPQFADLPPTRKMSYLDMDVINKTDSVDVQWQDGEEPVFDFNISGRGAGEVLLGLTFDYPYVPPKDFRANLLYSAEQVNSTTYWFEVILKNTTSNEQWETYLEDPTQAVIGYWTGSIPKKTGLGVQSAVSRTVKRRLFSWKYHGDVSKWLTLKTGEILFSKKSEYDLQLKITFKSRIPHKGSTCKIRLRREAVEGKSEFTIWGSIHGISGTDTFGYDVWTELVYGARTIIVMSFGLSALAVVLGLPFGILAGRFKGWTDNIVMVTAETFLSMPIVPLLLICVCFMRSLDEWLPVLFWFLPAIAIIAFRNVYLTSPINSKSKRSQVFALFRYSLANFCFTAISVSLILISLEFLGFGDPNLASWGRMLYRAYYTGGLVARAWWTYTIPIGCILLFITGLFLIGSSLDEA